ncbi:hypothetical protein [Pseudomonas vanderleydeniana]|uniref:DUF1640 domain-containing protein n=1 Tax=Pseudomonas vanderleydeniana TaxID=2745495 RepID=A0A9E6PGG0_9PSED|nr:hypothetical protein [Pseudomonas vanderleydeniana]QXI26407.1 hypothetical protein HU752_021000 [Pseudomonas vanderleydeniana]
MNPETTLYKTQAKSNVTKQNAMSIIASLDEAMTSAFARKIDLQVLRTELKNELRVLRSEMKTDRVVLKSELKTDLIGLRSELKEDIIQVRFDPTVMRVERKTQITKPQTIGENPLKGVIDGFTLYVCIITAACLVLIHAVLNYLP